MLLGPLGAVAQEAAHREEVGVLCVQGAGKHVVRLLQHRQRLAPLALRAQHLPYGGEVGSCVHVRRAEQRRVEPVRLVRVRVRVRVRVEVRVRVRVKVRVRVRVRVRARRRAAS